MAKTIVLSNQKGGVGKTTTANALAVGFKSRGFSVLAVDMDPQGNLSFSLGADAESSATIYDVLKGELKTHCQSIGRRCFAYAAFLVGKDDGLCHYSYPLNR